MTDLPTGYYWLQFHPTEEPFIAWCCDGGWRLDRWMGVFHPMTDMTVLNPHAGPLMPRAPEPPREARDGGEATIRAAPHPAIDALMADVQERAAAGAIFGLGVAIVTSELDIEAKAASAEGCDALVLAATDLLHGRCLTAAVAAAMAPRLIAAKESDHAP